jgi:hypothetical protein
LFELLQHFCAVSAGIVIRWIVGKYRINVVAHGSEMTAIGAEQLATHITDLQTKLRIEQTEQGRIALVDTSLWLLTVSVF